MSGQDMEDMETFEHINQWEPGPSVLPSIPNEEHIGSVRKQLSGTLVKQKLVADQGTFTKDLKKVSELQHAKQKEGLQTKVLPKDQEEFLNSTQLPPGLLDDILSLRADFPEEDGIDLGTKVLSQSKQNKSSSQDTAKFKTFDAANFNAYGGVEFHDNGVKHLDETDVSVHDFVDFSIVKKKSFQGCEKSSLEKGAKLSIKPSVAKGCALFSEKSASVDNSSASFSESSAFNDEGSTSFTSGSASIYNGITSFDNSSASIDKGNASFANGSAPIDKDIASFANGSAPVDKGIASFANGSAPVDKGIASFANGSAPVDKGIASFANGSAPVDKGRFANGNAGQLEGPAGSAVNTILANHFASKGKLFRPLDLQGTSGYTGISNTVSVSELVQAAKYHGCTSKIMFLPCHIPPNTNGPHRPSNMAEMGESCGLWKPAELVGLGNPAKQGYGFNIPLTTPQTSSYISNQANVQITHTQPLRNATMVNQGRATQFQTEVPVPMLPNRSMPDSANATPRANQNNCSPSNPNIVAQPEPPDLTHYTCSDELKHALQMKFLPFSSGQTRQNLQLSGTAYGQRHHPYTRPEASSAGKFQTSLPNLPEFMQNVSK